MQYCYKSLSWAYDQPEKEYGIPQWAILGLLLSPLTSEPAYILLITFPLPYYWEKQKQLKFTNLGIFLLLKLRPAFPVSLVTKQNATLFLSFIISLCKHLEVSVCVSLLLHTFFPMVDHSNITEMCSRWPFVKFNMIWISESLVKIENMSKWSLVPPSISDKQTAQWILGSFTWQASVFSELYSQQVFTTSYLKNKKEENLSVLHIHPLSSLLGSSS